MDKSKSVITKIDGKECRIFMNIRLTKYAGIPPDVETQ